MAAWPTHVQYQALMTLYQDPKAYLWIYRHKGKIRAYMYRRGSSIRVSERVFKALCQYIQPRTEGIPFEEATEFTISAAGIAGIQKYQEYQTNYFAQRKLDFQRLRERFIKDKS